MYENIPRELRELKQWVCVNNYSKVPMRAWENKAASSTDPTCWSDFETATQSVENGNYDGIGFVFNTNGIVGIDIDDICYDDEGFLSQTAADIINACGSYTERSRSGRGLHIFIKGQLPFSGANNLGGIEIYQAARYFIMTGKNIFFDIITDNQAALDHVVDKYFANQRDAKDNPSGNIICPISYAQPDGDKYSLKPIVAPISKGGRHISLVSVAGQLRNIGYSLKQLYTELLRINSIYCQPPLPLKEIQSITESMKKYE